MRRARPSGMRAVWVVLGLVVSGFGLVVGAAAPAAACSCVQSSLRQYVEGADVIVSGYVEEADEADDGLFGTGTGTAGYQVRVESTWKGRATRDLLFTSAADGSACGVEGLEADRRYVLFLSRGRASLSSSLCSGNQASSPDLERRLEALTGDASEPLPSPETPAERGMWLPATGAVLTGLAAAAVLVWRRRTRP